MFRSLLVLFLFSASALGLVDMKVETVTRVQSLGDNPFPNGSDEITIYVQGPNRREEMRAFVGRSPADPRMSPPHMATVQRCGERKGYEIDLDNHEYIAEKLPHYPSDQEFQEAMAKARQNSVEKPHLPPNVRVESNTVDTGETQVLFGHTARHFITTVKETPLADLDWAAQEKTIDGWYFDMPEPEYSCWPPSMSALRSGEAFSVTMLTTGDKVNEIRPEIHHTGPKVPGFAVKVKIAIHDRKQINGQAVESNQFIEREVVGFSEEPLSPSLFEPPPGFKKVSRLYQHSSDRSGK